MEHYDNVLRFDQEEVIEIEDEPIDAIPLDPSTLEEQQQCVGIPNIPLLGRLVPSANSCTHCKLNGIQCKLYGARALGCLSCRENKLICDVITTHPHKYAKRPTTTKERESRKRSCVPSMKQILEKAKLFSSNEQPSTLHSNANTDPVPPQPIEQDSRITLDKTPVTTPPPLAEPSTASLGDAILSVLMVHTRMFEEQKKYGLQTEWFIKRAIPTIGQVLEEMDRSRVMLPDSKKLADIWYNGLTYDPSRTTSNKTAPTQHTNATAPPFVTTSSSTVRKSTTTTQTTTSIAPIYLPAPMTIEQAAVSMGYKPRDSNNNNTAPPSSAILHQIAHDKQQQQSTPPIQYAPVYCCYPVCKGVPINGKSMCNIHENTITQKLGSIKKEP
jgi:hypothetical protein